MATTTFSSKVESDALEELAKLGREYGLQPTRKHTERDGTLDDSEGAQREKRYDYRWNLLTTKYKTSQEFFCELSLFAEYSGRIRAVIDCIIHEAVLRDFAGRSHNPEEWRKYSEKEAETGSALGTQSTRKARAYHPLWVRITELHVLTPKEKLYCDFLCYHYSHFIRRNILRDMPYHSQAWFYLNNRSAFDFFVQFLLFVIAVAAIVIASTQSAVSK